MNYKISQIYLLLVVFLMLSQFAHGKSQFLKILKVLKISGFFEIFISRVNFWRVLIFE